MKYWDIAGMPLINDVDETKVREIADSILKNGWVGCPILVYDGRLMTGSHRLAALNMLAEDYDIDMDVAEDVTDIVNANIDAFYEENGWVPDLHFQVEERIAI